MKARNALLAAGAVVTIALVFAPDDASAECSTKTVCYTQHGRRVCRSEQICVSPRPRTCSFRTVCTPMRTCIGSTCVYRDVCRRQEVCF